MTNQERKQATEMKYLVVLQELHQRLKDSPRLKAHQFMREMEVSCNLFKILLEGGVLKKKGKNLYQWNSMTPTIHMATRTCEGLRARQREYWKQVKEAEEERTCLPVPGPAVEVKYNEVAEVMEEVGRITVKDLEQVQPDEEVQPPKEVQGRQAVEYWKATYLWGLFTVRKVKLI